MKGDTTIAIVLVVTGAALVGLVLWGRSRASAAMGRDDPGSPLPSPSPVGPFPSLQVGQLVLVDSAAARLPPPFDLLPQQAATVDMLLQDPLLVSVTVGIPGVQSFSGTIPRSAILRVISPSPPTVFT